MTLKLITDDAVLSLLGSTLLSDERLVDVRDDTAAGNGRLDQAVELLVSANGELEMARRDALDFQVLRCVSGQLEHLEMTQFSQEHKYLTANRFETPAGSCTNGENYNKSFPTKSSMNNTDRWSKESTKRHRNDDQSIAPKNSKTKWRSLARVI